MQTTVSTDSNRQWATAGHISMTLKYNRLNAHSTAQVGMSTAKYMTVERDWMRRTEETNLEYNIT